MRLLRFVLALAAAALIHLAAVRMIPAFPQIVDLFLLVVVLHARDGEAVVGMFAGMAAGLVADGLSGAPYGLHGVANTLVGYIVAVVAQRLVIQRTSGLVLVFALAGALQQAILAALAFAMLPGAELPAPTWLAVKALSTGLLGLAWTAARRTLGLWRGARRERRAARMSF